MTTKIALFLTLLRKFYFERLDRKTGWGNQEVRLEFECAVSEALSEIINKDVSAIIDSNGDIEIE